MPHLTWANLSLQIVRGDDNTKYLMSGTKAEAGAGIETALCGHFVDLYSLENFGIANTFTVSSIIK
jgi:hypothetical protein